MSAMRDDEIEIDGDVFVRSELPQIVRNLLRANADRIRDAKYGHLRADRAEAALARVTDDSMDDLIKRVAYANATITHEQADTVAREVLAVIRRAAIEARASLRVLDR